MCPRPGSAADCCGDVADLLHQAHGTWDLTEAVMEVEAVSVPVDRVDDYESGGDHFGGDDDALQCVGEQGSTETLAVQRLVESEPGQQYGRDLPRISPSEARGRSSRTIRCAAIV